MRANTALLALLCSLLYEASTAADTKADIAPAVVHGAFIVEFEDNHDSAAFYNDLGAESLEVDTRMDLSYSLFKGCSFQLKNVSDTDLAAKKISKLPAIKKIWPVRIHDRPDDKVVWAGDERDASNVQLLKRQVSEDDADTFTPHKMTQVDRLRAEGITGEGIRIAVVDSGINYHHPALGGCFGPGCLVSYGRDLVGDEYIGNNAPVPDDDPDDCDGHGTHVAGIIAAQSNPLGFTGAAPGVTLGAYKVFGCRGGLAEDILLAAFNEAFENGSDIITASISAASGWSEDAMSVAIARIVEAGVPCTFGAGNAGSNGLFYAGSPANGKRVTGIGSVDSEDTPLILKEGTFGIDNGSITQRFGWEPGWPEYANVTLPLWAVSQRTNISDDACGPLPDDTPDLSGYMVLIRSGACGYDFKASNVAAKGAKHIMLYSNEDGLRYVWVPDDVGILGAAMVPAEQGEEWVALLKEGREVTVRLVEPGLAADSVSFNANMQTGGYVSDFSSWGPTWDGEFSPQFLAPGGNILSTYPLNKGGYAVEGGTSMSTPFVAAAFALVAQARGTKDPSTLERALSGTSRATRWVQDPAQGLAPAPQQGAGLIQVYDAAYTTTLLSVASLSFNDTANFVPVRTFSIENLGTEDVSYEISNVPALTMYTFEEGSPRPAYFPNPIVQGVAEIDFSASRITVPAGHTAEITLALTPPSGLDASLLPVYSGFITINSTNDALAIPYQGVIGSMYALPRMLSEGYVYLSTWTDGLLNPVPANTTFRIPYPLTPSPTPGVGYPTSLVELNIGSPLVRCDVVSLDAQSVNTTEVLGVDIVGSIFEFPKEHVTRRFFITAITGILDDGSVLPEGRYALLVRALRIFGDSNKAEDYVEKQMVPFSIAYS